MTGALELFLRGVDAPPPSLPARVLPKILELCPWDAATDTHLVRLSDGSSVHVLGVEMMRLNQNGRTAATVRRLFADLVYERWRQQQEGRRDG